MESIILSRTMDNLDGKGIMALSFEYLTRQQIYERLIPELDIDFTDFITKRVPIYVERMMCYGGVADDECHQTYCIQFIPLPGFCPTYQQIIGYDYELRYKCIIRESERDCCIIA